MDQGRRHVRYDSSHAGLPGLRYLDAAAHLMHWPGTVLPKMDEAPRPVVDDFKGGG